MVVDYKACVIYCVLCEHIRGSYLCLMGSRMWDFLLKPVAAHEHSPAPVWNSMGIDNFMFGKKIIQGNTKMMQGKIMFGIKKFPWHLSWKLRTDSQMFLPLY